VAPVEGGTPFAFLSSTALDGDINGAGATDGSPVQLWTCDNGASQHWAIP
jgi:hypothetical protein